MQCRRSIVPELWRDIRESPPVALVLCPNCQGFIRLIGIVFIGFLGFRVPGIRVL